MPDAPARLDIQRGSSLTTLRGEIDAHTAPHLAEYFVDLPSGTGDIDIDMGGVEFMDSSGLRVVIDVHQRAESAGRRLVIHQPSAPVVRLFEISGLTAHLHVVS